MAKRRQMLHIECWHATLVNSAAENGFDSRTDGWCLSHCVTTCLGQVALSNNSNVDLVQMAHINTHTGRKRLSLVTLECFLAGLSREENGFVF